MHLTVNQLDLSQVIWQSLVQEGQHISDGVRIYLVQDVDDRLHIFESLKTNEDVSKLVAINTTVVEHYPIHNLGVEKAACLSQTLTMAFGESILVQA